MSFNTFGHLFRVTTFGESHGVAIGCVVDGCPPLIPLTVEDIQARSRPPPSRASRASPPSARNRTAVKILSGVMAHPESGVQVTTGHADCALIENTDQRSKDYSEIKDKFRPGTPTSPMRPNTACAIIAAADVRPARETATRVAAGAIARKILPDVKVRGALVQMGPAQDRPRKVGLGRDRANPFNCPDKDKAAFFESYLDGIRKSRLLDRRRD
jgi:chorismate synthase